MWILTTSCSNAQIEPTLYTLDHFMLAGRALRDLWYSGCGRMSDKARRQTLCHKSYEHIHFWGKFLTVSLLHTDGEGGKYKIS